ncbi:MAG TPA: ATP-dependent 6-phosphofructokinase [Candidatus Cloacimonetes bacterium]|nr:ATP-dependent 6-phosphofructokinase [Candidatus Cloacimonadota bacterium]
MNKCLVVTGGGDCPGLNAVIRAIVKRASNEGNWEIYGSRDAFNGILKDPIDIVHLTGKKVSGIHVRGGTILGTTNKGGPFNFPVEVNPGEWVYTDRSDDLLSRLEELEFQAVINIGGDGSQKISQKLYEKGLNIIGVPKTIDNDLECTDFTFGFQTAVEIATDAVDKLVTTAASHHRVMILEVMGREAGWIALYAALAGGAEVCLIPEIPYNIDKIKKKIDKRNGVGKGFVNIVMAEGAKPLKGKIDLVKNDSETNNQTFKYAGAGFHLKHELETIGVKNEIRVTVLGHLQRGGSPNSFDRILATRFGIKAFELVLQKDFGKMVAYRNNDISAVPIKAAIKQTNLVDINSNIVHTARGLGISFGD